MDLCTFKSEIQTESELQDYECPSTVYCCCSTSKLFRVFTGFLCFFREYSLWFEIENWLEIEKWRLRSGDRELIWDQEVIVEELTEIKSQEVVECRLVTWVLWVTVMTNVTIIVLTFAIWIPFVSVLLNTSFSQYSLCMRLHSLHLLCLPI